MKRWCVLAAGVLAASVTAFISGASRPPEIIKPVPDEKKPEEAKQLRIVAQRTAYFNMAAVMRDFNQAKYRVWLLTNKKTEMSKDLLAWRNEYIELQKQVGQPNPPRPQDPPRPLDEKIEKMRQLARQIEDEDRKINKQLNSDASAIISDLYDKIYVVVEKTAQLNGFQAVLTYPDAVTPEELNKPYVKELKLKPPALHPFEIEPRVEITAIVVRTLNGWYPAVDKAGKPVDVTKLDLAGWVPSQTVAPPPIVPAGGKLPPPPPPMPRDLPPIPAVPKP